MPVPRFFLHEIRFKSQMLYAHILINAVGSVPSIDVMDPVPSIDAMGSVPSIDAIDSVPSIDAPQLEHICCADSETTFRFSVFAQLF